MAKNVFFMLALSALVVPGIAGATSLSGPFTTTTPIPYSLTDWAGTLSFPQFNPALGTLTEVDLTVTGAMQTTLTVTNDDVSTSSSGSAKTELQMTVQDPGLILTAPEIDMIGPTFTYSLAPLASLGSGLLTEGKSDTEYYTNSAILAEFTGLGSEVLNASTFTETLLANTGGNTHASQVTDASLTGTVTYKYESTPPVPEPLTMIGVCLGIGALGRYFRRHPVTAK